MLENLRADFARAVAVEDGGRPRRALLALSAPGFQAVAVYRFGRWALGLPALARWPLGLVYHFLYFFVRALWGIEVPRKAAIGPGLYIGHFGGIHVSGRAVIGANCALSQGITIGVTGDGADCGIPVIGDDVYIAPGARVFGRIRIGNNVKIGPNTCVYRDVPDNAVLVLDPGYTILSYKGNRPVRRSDKPRIASTG